MDPYHGRIAEDSPENDEFSQKLLLLKSENIQFLDSVFSKLRQSGKFRKPVVKWRYEYLFTVTVVKKMKWFLSLTRCHFQPRVTEGHEWLEMAPSEK